MMADAGAILVFKRDAKKHWKKAVVLEGCPFNADVLLMDDRMIVGRPAGPFPIQIFDLSTLS